MLRVEDLGTKETEPLEGELIETRFKIWIDLGVVFVHLVCQADVSRPVNAPSTYWRTTICPGTQAFAGGRWPRFNRGTHKARRLHTSATRGVPQSHGPLGSLLVVLKKEQRSEPQFFL